MTRSAALEAVLAARFVEPVSRGVLRQAALEGLTGLFIHPSARRAEFVSGYDKASR